MDLGEYIVMRVGLALLIVAVIVGFRLILALLLKGVNALLKLIGKEPGAKPQIQAKQPPKAPVVPKPPVVPHTPVVPKQPEPPKPPVTPPVQSYKPPVQSYQPPVTGKNPQPYSGTVPLDPGHTTGQWNTPYSLRCVRGPMQGQRFPILIPGCCTIGRNPGNQIVFPAQTPGVSSKHCKLEAIYECAIPGGAGYEISLTDCGSTYGTYSGFGQRIPAGSGHPLQVGEAFFLGSPNGPGFVLEKQ